ncbi:MAG: hypothetical protein HPY69_13290, partial [Armatimonadetes bacterium]|nr:hypothetical protein [Armatimonadota bacterium]
LIIIHNPPQTHNVPWSITHAAREGPTFTVTVEVCDMSGGVVVTHSETQVGPGSGSWTWDGKINGVDAAKGLYISRVYTSHYFQGAGGCSDRDKTDVLSEVSLDAFAWVEPDFPDRAAVMLQYTLAQACSDVTVTAYAPNLETTTIYVPTDGTLPGSAGTHNVFVEFKVRRDQMGPYSFVITGMQADGSANRDGLPKALVPQGAVQAVAAPATTVASDGFGSWFFDLAKAATLAEQTEHNLPYAIGSAEATTWAITDTLKHAAVLAYYGHSDATSIGDGSGNNKYLFSSDLDGLSVGHVLFALWGGCDTANPTQYTGENWLVASQRNGIDCAVGWTTSVSLGALAKFAEFLWHDLSADSAWVSLACNDAAWTTHLWFLCVPTGILNYNMYGDVQLMPARFGER